MVKRKAAARKMRTQKQAELREKEPETGDGVETADAEPRGDVNEVAEGDEAAKSPAANAGEAEGNGQAEQQQSEHETRSGSGKAEGQPEDREAAQESARDPFDELEEEEVSLKT